MVLSSTLIRVESGAECDDGHGRIAIRRNLPRLPFPTLHDVWSAFTGAFCWMRSRPPE